jgi:hypothetical protein
MPADMARKCCPGAKVLSFMAAFIRIAAIGMPKKRIRALIARRCGNPSKIGPDPRKICGFKARPLKMIGRTHQILTKR